MKSIIVYLVILVYTVIPSVTFAQFNKTPKDLINLVQQIQKNELEKEWSATIGLWNEVIQKYPEEHVGINPHGNGLFVGHYRIGDIYAQELDNLDSAFSHFSYIVKYLPNRNFGTYEGENPGDVRVVVHWAKLLKQQGLNDSTQLAYLKNLREKCSSAQALAAVDIESAAILYRADDAPKGEALLLDIINGPDLRWIWFKSSGDFRWSAITSVKQLGSEYVGKKPTYDVLSTLVSSSLPSHLQLILSFSLGELCLSMGDSLLAKDYFKSIQNVSNTSLRTEYPFSFSPDTQLQEEYVFKVNLRNQLEALELLPVEKTIEPSNPRERIRSRSDVKNKTNENNSKLEKRE